MKGLVIRNLPVKYQSPNPNGSRDIANVKVFVTDGETDRQTDRQTERQTDRQTERQTNRQRQRETEENGVLHYLGTIKTRPHLKVLAWHYRKKTERRNPE